MKLKFLKFITSIIIEFIFIAGFLFCLFATVNTMVSIKYETDSGNGCISGITGENLCIIQSLWTVATITFFILSMGTFIFILKNKRK